MSHKVIAIDGTAASGKGTLARKIADILGYAYLDTGKLYRYVGNSIIVAGGDPADKETAIAAAQAMKDNIAPTDLQDDALTTDEAGQAASKVASIDEVRKALLEYQKNFAKNPPKGFSGAVLDGRDIGTVICPEADVKFYVTAETPVRAERRHKELQSKGISATYDAVLADMEERDARDAGRQAAPMKPADDAIMLDTSEMTIEDVLQMALSHIKGALQE